MTTCQFVFYRKYLSGNSPKSYIYICYSGIKQTSLGSSCHHERCPDTCLWPFLTTFCLSWHRLSSYSLHLHCGVSLFLLKASPTLCVVLLVTCLTLCTTKCTRTWTSPSATTTLLRLTTHTWRGTSSFLSPRWICTHGYYKRAVGVWKVSGVRLNMVNRPFK